MKNSHSLFLYHHYYCHSMIHSIEPYYPFDCNCYLLTGDDNVLIDTGTGLNSKYLIESIKDIIGTDGVLDRILLTHCHFDHIGGARALIEAFGSEVYAGHIDAIPIRNADPLYTLSDDLDIRPIEVSDLFHGDIIDLGQHRLHVIETPGHTQGGVCFYDEISSSLFSGDTIFSNSVGRTDFFGGSIASLRNSIKYLIDIAVKELYPGHGDVTSDWHAAIRSALQIVGD